MKSLIKAVSPSTLRVQALEKELAGRGCDFEKLYAAGGVSQHGSRWMQNLAKLAILEIERSRLLGVTQAARAAASVATNPPLPIAAARPTSVPITTTATTPPAGSSPTLPELESIATVIFGEATVQEIVGSNIYFGPTQSEQHAGALALWDQYDSIKNLYGEGSGQEQAFRIQHGLHGARPTPKRGYAPLTAGGEHHERAKLSEAAGDSAKFARLKRAFAKEMLNVPGLSYGIHDISEGSQSMGARQRSVAQSAIADFFSAVRDGDLLGDSLGKRSAREFLRTQKKG